MIKFAVLLRKIVSFARSSDTGKLEIILHKRGAELELREQCPDASSVLSTDIAKLWNADNGYSNDYAICTSISDDHCG